MYTEEWSNADVELVKHGDLIRLEHVMTRRNVHSHQQPAPLSKKQFQVRSQNPFREENYLGVYIRMIKIAPNLPPFLSILSFFVIISTSIFLHAWNKSTSQNQKSPLDPPPPPQGQPRTWSIQKMLPTKVATYFSVVAEHHLDIFNFRLPVTEKMVQVTPMMFGE